MSYVPDSQTSRQASLPCFGLRTTLSSGAALAQASWLDAEEGRTTIAKMFNKKVLKEGLPGAVSLLPGGTIVVRYIS